MIAEIADYARTSRKAPFQVEGHLADGRAFAFSFSQGVAKLTVEDRQGSAHHENPHDFMDEETFLSVATRMLRAL
jgi:hypothetical protein